MNFRIFRAVWIMLLVLGIGRLASQAAIITSFSPEAGTPGDQITLTGSGFTAPGLTVKFWDGNNGQIAPIVYISSDSMVIVKVPTGAITGPITAGDNYTAVFFTVVSSGPYISSLSPDFGATNDMIIINGAHLSTATVVKFGGIRAEANPTSDGTQVSARVPYGAKSGYVTVTTPSGTATSPEIFTIIGPGPYLSTFNPTTGGNGTLVGIEGRFLLGVTAVRFNGVNASSFTSNSDTLIQARAPSGVITGPITVVTRAGTSTTSSLFYAPPAITNLSVSAGRTGSNVVLKGVSFLGATAVSFNGLIASFIVTDNWQIQTLVPAGATTGPIWVYAPGGTAFSSTFKVPPTLYSFSPTYGQAGSTVTLTGTNFIASNLAVKFNGVAAASPKLLSSGRVTAVVPAGATTGPITISTGDGSDTSLGVFYLPPTISGFSPTNSAPGTTVTISGANLLGASSVKFNGAPASFVPPVNNSTLVATVPATVSSGPIQVIAPAGTATSSGIFYAAPVITGFSPTHGMPNTSVTISGANLLGTSAVLFNGRSALISSVANNQVVAIVPGGAQTGPITVVAPAGSANTASNFVLDYSIDLQVSVVDAPDPVTVSSNLVYTITLLNNSAYDCPNVTFTNTLSSLVQLKSATTTRGTLATNGNMLTCDLGWLTNHTTATVTLRVAPQAVGTLTNTAVLAGYYPDPNTANNSATTLTTVDPLALLSIYRPSPARVRVSWPAALTNYVLEYKKLLSTNVYWSNVTTVPIVSGDQQFVTETNSEAAQFYRLRK